MAQQTIIEVPKEFIIPNIIPADEWQQLNEIDIPETETNSRYITDPYRLRRIEVGTPLNKNGRKVIFPLDNQTSTYLMEYDAKSDSCCHLKEFIDQPFAQSMFTDDKKENVYFQNDETEIFTTFNLNEIKETFNYPNLALSYQHGSLRYIVDGKLHIFATYFNLGFGVSRDNRIIYRHLIIDIKTGIFMSYRVKLQKNTELRHYALVYNEKKKKLLLVGHQYLVIHDIHNESTKECFIYKDDANGNGSGSTTFPCCAITEDQEYLIILQGREQIRVKLCFKFTDIRSSDIYHKEPPNKSTVVES